jgi:hypothetical protein
MSKKHVLLISIFLLLVLVVACVPVLELSSSASITQTVFDQAIAETITSRAFQQGNSGHELSTALANATALSQTITAQAVIDNSSYPMTATAIEPALEELQHYGISPFDGSVAWLHKPVTITLNGPNQFGYANDYPQTIAKDFVFAADITWNTNNGLAGCGFIFHSDGNSSGPNQLMVLITRFAEGTAVYSAMAGGNITNLQNYYPWTKDRSFNWQNDSTNRLVIVVRANLIDIYTNSVLIAQVDTTKPPPSTLNLPTIPGLPANPSAVQLQAYQQILRQYQVDGAQAEAELAQVQQNYYSNKIASLSDGFLGFAASSSSGITNCTFSKGWLFLFNQPPTPTPTITPTFNGTPYTITATPTLTKVLTPFFLPTRTPTRSAGGGAPTAVHPTATSVPPTGTIIQPTASAVAPTDTAVLPTDTPVPPPTDTPVPPPTDTPVPPPTDTPVPPPTATQPPAATATP